MIADGCQLNCEKRLADIVTVYMRDLTLKKRVQLGTRVVQIDNATRKLVQHIKGVHEKVVFCPRMGHVLTKRFGRRRGVYVSVVQRFTLISISPALIASCSILWIRSARL